MVEKELKALGIEGGELQKEARSGQGLYRAVQIEALEAVGRGQEGLHPPGRDPAAHDGEQPTAGFVLGPEAPLSVPLLTGTVYARLDLRSKGGLEVGDAFRLFFGWERRGALSLACNR
jgi:hypothetical protein